MKKKICNFYSFGSLDPTQGGSSLFNYHFIKYLLKKKLHVNAVLYGDKNFYKTQVNSYDRLNFNRKFKINYIFLKKKKFNITNNIFSEIINKFFSYDELFNFFLLNKYKIEKNHINITRGFGWACVFSKFNIKNINLLNDPLLLQYKLAISSERKYLSKIKNIFIYLLFNNIYKKISFYFKLNNFCKFYSHSPQHIKYYNENNIKTKYVPTFEVSNKLSYLKNAKNYFLENYKNNFINICFVGSLDTTASRVSMNFIKNFFKDLNVNIKINLFFLTNPNKFFDKIKDIKDIKNIKIHFINKKLKLSNFMKKMHLGMYLGDYNIGIRQRIIFMMSYAVPVLCHVNNNDSLIFFKNNKDILYYKNDDELLKIFSKILRNKKFLLKLKINSFFSQRKFYDVEKNSNLFFNEIIKEFKFS